MARALLLAGVSGAIVLALALGAYVYEHGRRDLIAPGVRIAGVNVGGLRAAAARARPSGGTAEHAARLGHRSFWRASVHAERRSGARDRGCGWSGTPGSEAKPGRLVSEPDDPGSVGRPRRQQRPAAGHL